MALLATPADFRQQQVVNTASPAEGGVWQQSGMNLMQSQPMPAWSWFVPAMPAGQTMMVAQQVPSDGSWMQSQPRPMPAPPQRPAPASLMTSQHMPPPPSKHANTMAAKNKKSSASGNRGRVLFGISGISRLPVIRDFDQSDTLRLQEDSLDCEPVAQGMAEEQESPCGSSPSCTFLPVASQSTCASVSDLPERHVTVKLASPAVSPAKSLKATSWADLYDREEEADDASSTCDSRSDHLGSHTGTQPLSEPSSPRSSCAFAHATSQSGDIDSEDVDAGCCPVEASENECADAQCVESTDSKVEEWHVATADAEPQPHLEEEQHEVVEGVMESPFTEAQPAQVDADAAEDVMEPSSISAEVDVPQTPSKSQLKKQRRAATRQAEKKAPATVDKQSVVLTPKEDSIKLSRREQSTVQPKPQKPQKQGQKQLRRTSSQEGKSCDVQESAGSRDGNSLRRAVLGWLRLVMRVVQRYPVSTVLAVTMLGYGGMMLPGLSQPQLQQPSDAPVLASRTIHPKKKVLSLGDADASPKAKMTKSGKATRKASPKYRREM